MGLVAGEGEPHERVVRVAGIDLDVAVPQLAFAVEVDVVRGNDDRQLGRKLGQGEAARPAGVIREAGGRGRQVRLL
jgi:hypothetical protein